MKYPYLALIIFILTVLSCGAGKPAAEKLYAWVDNVNVRANPDPSLPAITQLPEGKELVFYGEVSSNQTTYNLRGEDITAPFVKVQYGTNTNMTAWVFKGALKTAAECGIDLNLSLLDAIKSSNTITVRYLVQNGKSGLDGKEDLLQDAVDTALKYGFIDLAQYLLDKYHLTYQGKNILDHLPKSQYWKLDLYISNVFGPVRKVVTNSYKSITDYGSHPYIDIDYYYKFGFKIKYYHDYIDEVTEHDGNVFFIPYTTVEQAFDFLLDNNVLSINLKEIKDLKLPKNNKKYNINSKVVSK